MDKMILRRLHRQVAAGICGDPGFGALAGGRLEIRSSLRKILPVPDGRSYLWTGAGVVSPAELLSSRTAGRLARLVWLRAAFGACVLSFVPILLCSGLCAVLAVLALSGAVEDSKLPACAAAVALSFCAAVASWAYALPNAFEEPILLWPGPLSAHERLDLSAEGDA